MLPSAASDDEWTATAGWNLVAPLAKKDGEASGVPAGELAARMDVVESGVHAAVDRVRYAINNALIVAREGECGGRSKKVGRTLGTSD